MSDRLSEIAEREKAATPGEWEHVAGYPCEIWHTLPVVKQITSGGGGTVFRRDPQNASHVYEMASSTWTVENAMFIAHARQDIPWLLANTQAALALIRQVRDGNGWREIPVGVLNQIEAILLGKEGGDGGK